MEENACITPEEASTLITTLDKVEGFKRFMLVIPMEVCFIVLGVILAYQGQTEKAIGIIGVPFGIMTGYFFGKADQPVQQIKP
jgi:hypothetical protein